MFRNVFTGLVLMAVFASSAFASSEISCRYDGIANDSWPDRGPDRSDMFKFTNLAETEGAFAAWTPFANIGGETQPLDVTEVKVFRCTNCFEITAQTSLSRQTTQFKVTIKQDPISGEVRSNIVYRMNFGGPADWVSFNDKPGACWIEDRS
jgi:hypothetical protein